MLSEKELAALVPIDVAKEVQSHHEIGTFALETNCKEYNCAQLFYIYCRQARKMAGKQACKMAGKQTFHIKGKDVLSAAPVQVPRFERIPSMFCLET